MLWHKLLKSRINGKCFACNKKKNIYEQRYKIKKIYINGFSSDFFFTCNGCVRQGEKLSPLLFSLYNNDLEDYLLYKNVAALFTITKRIKKELIIYI